jgi:biopolymer transport protein ExbB
MGTQPVFQSASYAGCVPARGCRRSTLRQILFGGCFRDWAGSYRRCHKTITTASHNRGHSQPREIGGMAPRAIYCAIYCKKGNDIVRKIVAALALLLPVASHAWWNDDWNYRKELTLDLTAAGANIAGSTADVPVLIRLHIGNFGYFADTKPDGADFRVIAGDDKTPLKFHVERFDAANQMAFIWVRVPKLAGGTASEKIYLYYGNPKAPAASDIPGSYDSNQALVYHFDSAESITDATAFGNKPSGSNAELTTASLIGGGAKFSGEASIGIPSSASLRLLPQQGFTASSWVRIDAPQTDAYVLALEDPNAALALTITGTAVAAQFKRSGAAAATAQSADILSVGQWHHLSLIYRSGRLVLYVDGIEVAGTPAEIPELAGTLTLGNSAAGGHGLTGELDEVQVANIARAPEWVMASARSQGQETPLLGYGGDAQREGDDVSYMKVTMQNVTVDGWVVIVILAVMFVIAMLIIISKALYLAKVKRDNGAFLREFSKLRGDPTALDRAETGDGDAALDESSFMPHVKDGEDRFRMSTIYRLYHHGVQEMLGRTQARSVGAAAVRSMQVRTLNSQTMNAIRAAMDASSVRMGQKLSSQMVLLTIAISGGPFLGLLGTVVGVMITFAAIAASGDVNVNAIAPGIAAALAATVAGLAVAIPALFGYNWLNMQIKEINADMRVFIDEFVTRVAEEYS